VADFPARARPWWVSGSQNGHLCFVLYFVAILFGIAIGVMGAAAANPN
jgi:hypothetical protein